MAKIRLTKTPNFKERLIDIKGQSVSNINLEGSFALNLRTNEPFISYDSSEDAWFLNIDTDSVDLTSINSSISTLNSNVTNIQNTINGYESPWIFVAAPLLDVRGYNQAGAEIYYLGATSIDADPNTNYFANKNVYFKYKVVGSTVFMQYRLGIDIPATVANSSNNLHYIKIDLIAINPILTARDGWINNYYASAVMPAAKRPADHLQMCFYDAGKLIHTCNTFQNGHHGEPIGFNFDFGVANAYTYTGFKLIIAGTHVYERNPTPLGSSSNTPIGVSNPPEEPPSSPL